MPASLAGHQPTGPVGAVGLFQPVPPEVLAGLFRVLRDNVRLVVLNACDSEAQARAIVGHIDCAVGMNHEIGDKAAIAFAAEFYQALGYGRSVKDAFDLGVVRLIGEGVSKAHDLAKLHTREGVDPSKLILVGAGPADPVAAETTTPPPGDIEDEIRAVLRPLMGDPDQRKARLDRAFNTYPALIDRIHVQGETGVFLPLLLKTLREFGEVRRGVPAVRVLLESVKGEVGAQDRERIERILDALGR